MRACLSHLRRLVASVMLVAMASFVLHGAAMAGFHAHGVGGAKCQPQSTQVHQHAPAHDHAAHHHANAVVHSHSADAAQVAVDQPGAGPEHIPVSDPSPCCSTACAVSLAASTVPAVSGPVPSAAAILPARQDGFGTDPSGPKRPPRTPCIA